MLSNIQKIVVSFLSTVLIVTLAFLLYSIKNDEFAEITPLESSEQYRVHLQERIPREALSLYLVTDEMIVLFFDYEGIVNVYSLSGKFQYGLQVEALKNGIGDMAFDGKYLYVHSRGNTMYIFDQTTLIRCFRKIDDPIAYKQIEMLMEPQLNHQLEDTVYYLVSNAIMKSVNGAPMQTVISLPKQDSSIHGAIILFLLVMGVLAHYLRTIRDKL